LKAGGLAGKSPAFLAGGGLILTPGEPHQNAEFVEDFLAEE
jgi:hypothetical protein